MASLDLMKLIDVGEQAAEKKTEVKPKPNQAKAVAQTKSHSSDQQPPSDDQVKNGETKAKRKRTRKPKSPVKTTAPADAESPVAQPEQVKNNGKMTNSKTVEESVNAREEGAFSDSKKRDIPPKDLIRDWAKSYRIPAPEAQIERWKAKTHFNFASAEGGVFGENPHGLLAAYRQAVTVLAMQSLIERGHTCIDILYYSKRDIGVVENLKRFLANRTDRTVTFNFLGDVVTPADMVRRFPTGHTAVGTACFVIDVYHDNESSDTQPMTINTFERYGYVDAIWAGHVFPGAFGTLDTACWRRDDENMITWYSDNVNLAYPAHPACDDMATPAANGRYASTVQYSPHLDGKIVYRIMLVSQCTSKATPAQAEQISSGWMKTEIPDYSSLPTVYRFAPDWARKLIPVGNYRIWVKTEHVRTLTAELSKMGKTYYSFAAFQTFVKNTLDNDHDFVRLEQAFPNELQGYRHVLACALFAHQAKFNTDVLIATRDAVGTHLSHYEIARRNIATPVDPVEKSKLIAVGGWALAALVMLAAIRYWRMRVASASPAVFQQAVTEAVTDKVALAADNFLVVEGNWDVTTSRVINIDNNWFTLLMLWAKECKPANAGLLERVRRLFQSAVDRMRNHLPHRQIGRLLHSWVDRAVNRLEKPAIEVRAAATATAGLAVATGMSPFNPAAVADVIAAPLVEEGIKHAVPHWIWKVTTSTAFAAYDMAQYGNRATWFRFAWHMAFHHITAFMPLEYAVPAHITYNAMATAFGLGKMSSNVDPLTVSKIMAKQFHAAIGSAYDDLERCADRVMVCLDREMPTDCLLTFDDHNYQALTEPGVLQTCDRIWGPVGVGLCEVPAYDARPVSPPEFDPAVKTSKLPKLVKKAKDPQVGYYRAIYHNAPMFKPAKSMHNMIAVIAYRLRKRVARPVPGMWSLAYTCFSKIPFQISDPDQIVSPKVTFSATSIVDLFLHDRKHLSLEPTSPAAPWLREVSSYVDSLDARQAFENWLVHTDQGKKKRYIAAFEQLLSVPLTLSSKEVTQVVVNIKTDEVLLKIGDPNLKKNGSIPRPIHAVNPKVVVALGPSIHRATGDLKTALHEGWVGRVFGWDIFLRFAAGSTDKQLSEWLTAANEYPGLSIVIFVAGDDSLVVVKYGDKGRLFFTGDLTACDRSIGPDALSVEWQVLLDLSVPLPVIKALIANAKATLKCVVNDQESSAVFLYREHERNTGGPDTTFGNTVLVLIAWLTIVIELIANDLIQKPDADDLIARFKRFGFTMKMKINSDQEPGFCPEFLKGWWLPYHGLISTVYCWTPLPSRLLKAVKTIKDPRVTYKTALKDQATDMKLALQCHLSAVAEGLLPFGHPPCLRKVYEHWQQMNPTDRPLKAVDEDYYIGKTIADYARAPDLEDADFLRAVQHRYRINQDDMMEFLSVLTRVAVGDLFFHPVWEDLSADYA